MPANEQGRCKSCQEVFKKNAQKGKCVSCEEWLHRKESCSGVTRAFWNGGVTEKLKTFKCPACNSVPLEIPAGRATLEIPARRAPLENPARRAPLENPARRASPIPFFTLGNLTKY